LIYIGSTVVAIL